MPDSGQQTDTRAADSLEQMVTNLFDAVRYSEQTQTFRAQAKSLTKESETRLARVEDFSKELAASLRKLVETTGADYASELSSQVTEFAKAAVEQATAKEKKELSAELEEANARASSESTKALKSLELYWASAPLPLMDRVITVRRGSSGYDAEAAYTCKGEIQYGFTLATRNSKFFHNDFRFSLLGKKLNVPVELSRNWMKKEPTPRFEKLERYALSSAEVSDRHMIVEFENPETKAVLRLVTATAENENLATIEYTEGPKVVKVTSDTGLNKYIDSKAIASSLQELRAELLSLEKNKAALTSLVATGDDILESLHCAKLLDQILMLTATTYGSLIDRMRSRPVPTKNGTLGISLVRERLALLGASGAAVKSALSLK